MTQSREERVRRHLKHKLSDLFDVTEEVWGKWPFDDRSLRLDLLLKPNDKARKMGFDIDAIGIEIKDPKSKESVKKLFDCIMQAHTYTLCEFNGVRPSFVLIYPEIKDFFSYDFENKYKKDERQKASSREISLVRRLMQRANVGELVIDDNKDKYIFSFNATYFDSKKGRSKLKGVGTNRYIGSKKIQTYKE